MRLIDGDALKKNFPKDEDWEYPVNTNEYVCGCIDAQPTVDPVRHGRWEIPEGHGEARVCSECGMICHADRALFYNYCPNCGADVRPEWRKK